MAISIRYMDNIDDLIDSLDTKFPDWLGPIDRRLCNALRSKSASTRVLEGHYLDKDISNKLS